MDRKIKAKIKTKIILPISAILLVFGVILVTFFEMRYENNAIDMAENFALNSIKQFKFVREYYTKNIISDIRLSKDLKVHFDHIESKKVIPLPATFIQDLSSGFKARKIDIELRYILRSSLS